MTKRHLARFLPLAVVFLTAACQAGGARRILSERPVTQQDSVVLAGTILWDLGRRLDAFGRGSGGLPASLGPILDQAAGHATDPWGRSVRYTQQGLGFELRSPGPDGILDNGDDVVSLGRVGRDIPCETRNQYGTRLYEEIVARCSASPALVFPLCPSLLQLRPTEETAATPRDSVLLTGRRLVRFARIIDGVGREHGGLPSTLRAVPGHPRLPGWELPDAWGRSVAYTHDGQRFELRSAGPDARFRSADDVVVASQLGRASACAFQTAGGTVTCDAPPPACPS